MRGFALLWVLLSIALMGVGLVAAAQLQATVLQRERERELLAIGREFRAAIASYFNLEIPGRAREYPSTLDDLLSDPRVSGTRRHIRRIYVDPMTGQGNWGTLRVAGKIVGVHSLSNVRPIKQTNFDADEMGFEGRRGYSEWRFDYPAGVSTDRPRLVGAIADYVGTLRGSGP